MGSEVSGRSGALLTVFSFPHVPPDPASARRIHCFENVSVLVFVAAISEYDQVLFEDSTVNRLAEATMLWESIAGSRWFTQSAFVLMLNKVDLFANKILGAGPPLGAYFPDYTGPPRDLEAAKNYMRAKFIALNPRKDRGLYVHLTCATDTNQARVVLAAVMDQCVSRCAPSCSLELTSTHAGSSLACSAKSASSDRTPPSCIRLVTSFALPDAFSHRNPCSFPLCT